MKNKILKLLLLVCSAVAMAFGALSFRKYTNTPPVLKLIYGRWQVISTHDDLVKPEERAQYMGKIIELHPNYVIVEGVLNNDIRYEYDIIESLEKMEMLNGRDGDIARWNAYFGPMDAQSACLEVSIKSKVGYDFFRSFSNGFTLNNDHLLNGTEGINTSRASPIAHGGRGRCRMCGP